MKEIQNKQILLAQGAGDRKENFIKELGSTCKVESVFSVEEIRNFLSANQVDLLILALDSTPDFGMDFLKNFTENKESRDIPVICLYEGAEDKMEERCFDLGIQDFIKAPFRTAVLQKRIERVMELVQYREEAQKSARYDGLTGLYNRSYCEERIRSLLEAGQSGAFMMIDLDNFKEINDMYGHMSGDDVLRYFADILKQMSRENDIAARIGGDEFIFFMQGFTGRFSIMEKASKIIEKMTECMKNEGYGKICTVSIEIAIAGDDADDYDVLYKYADSALYDVKRGGKDDYRFYYETPVDSDDYDRLVDLTRIRYILEGRMDWKSGAFQVEYGDFKKIYDYIYRDIKRNGTEVQILLFTLKKAGEIDDNGIEYAMKRFEEAVHGSLRMVDIGTRYSKLQYIVILLETNVTNGKKVAERVEKNFVKLYDRGNIDLRYDIETVIPQT